MSTEVSKSKLAGSALESSRFDQYVSKQLNQTRNQVKLIDLMSSVMLLATILLGILLAVCVADAWVSPLGSIARLGVLILIIAVCCYFVLFRIAPLLIRKINPAYAAKVIENSKPSLKNSLLNYLFIRENKRHRTRVFSAVQQQAANDLSAVSVESTVDRSDLIKIGFALVAIVLIAGLYKVLSPKDPVQTLARVVAPLSDIQKPSQVRILEVTPGDADVFFGQALEVSARIRGVNERQDVLLVYSTDDGQYVDSVIQMTKGDGHNEYRCQLQTSPGGIQHSLTYRVVAGDGRSSQYKVTTRPNPTITVQSIDYQPPKYTELPPRSVSGHGDIQGIEGTRVKISARANMDIEHAYLELFPATQTTPENESSQKIAATELRPIKTISMESDERTAFAEFVLLLEPGTNRPKYAHYRLKFTNPDGEQNTQAVDYSIQVKPDIAPEVEILEPSETDSKLPENRTLRIKVRAVDPDFRISAIQIEGIVKGEKRIRQNLPLGKQTGLGNVESQFDFRPADFGLKSGDEVTYHAIAADNRMSPLSPVADPNRTRTDPYKVTIVDEVDGKDPLAGTDNNNEPGNSEASNDQNTGESGSEYKSNDSGSSNSDQKSGEKSDSGQGGGGSKSDSNAEAEASEESNDGGQSGSPQNSSGNSTNSNSSENSSSQGSDQGNPDNENPNPNSDRNPSGNKDSSNEKKDSNSDAGDGAGDSASEQKTSDGEPRNEGQGNEGEGSAAEPREAENSEMSSGNSDLGEDSTDADRIKRMLDYLEKKKQQDQDKNSSGDPELDEPSTDQGDATPESNNSDNKSSDETSNAAQPEKTDDSGSNSGEKDNSGESSETSDSNGGKSGDKTGQQNDGSDKSSDSSNEKNADGSEGSSQGSDSKDDKSAANPENRDSKDGDSQQDSDSNSDGSATEDKSSADKKSDENSSGNSGQDDKSSGNSESGSDKSSDGNQGSDSGQKSDESESQSGSNDPSKAKTNDDSNNSENRNDQNSESNPAESNSDSSGQQSNPDSKGKSNPDQTDDSEGSDSQDQSGNDSESSTSNNPSGGGKASKDSTGTQNNLDIDTIPPDEKERMEYAKKATDLVLDYLKDQKEDPDPELLELLNYTPDELREFSERWQRLSNQAKTGTNQDQKRYEDALRSLGLLSTETRNRQIKSKDDQITGLNEDGAENRVPSKHAEAFGHFLKGRSRADNQ